MFQFYLHPVYLWRFLPISFVHETGYTNKWHHKPTFLLMRGGYPEKSLTRFPKLSQILDMISKPIYSIMDGLLLRKAVLTFDTFHDITIEDVTSSKTKKGEGGKRSY